MFKRILVANRGEIAMRIMRCCMELGIETVLAYSKADEDSLPVQYAAKAVCVGPAPAGASYLNQDALIQTALAYKCEAVHPGYGFLSENAEFARRCEENGIAFIGPSHEKISRMGDKQSARELMIKSGVPVVPGSDGLLKDAADAVRTAERIGFPVLINASAGGGGRGMRIAYGPDEVKEAFESARAEAVSAFANGDMYMEKYIVCPRHIEVQLIGDKHGHVVHMGERDCSLQRRSQKMVEEAPAYCLNDEQRKGICEAALKAARAVDYDSVGTVEFVLDKDGNFYFIEMNTRIQVEHPVTEMVTGIDLMKAQIRSAAGVPLSFTQDDIQIRGHAIECRINAEDPAKNFAPMPGDIRFIHFPCGAGVRIETALYSGSTISPFYDSMISKVIVHAEGRLEAIRRMRMALAEFTVDGVKTNADFLYLLMFHPEYLKGNVTTAFFEEHVAELLEWDHDSGI